MATNNPIGISCTNGVYSASCYISDKIAVTVGHGDTELLARGNLDLKLKMLVESINEKKNENLLDMNAGNA